MPNFIRLLLRLLYLFANTRRRTDHEYFCIFDEIELGSHQKDPFSMF